MACSRVSVFLSIVSIVWFSGNLQPASYNVFFGHHSRCFGFCCKDTNKRAKHQIYLRVFEREYLRAKLNDTTFPSPPLRPFRLHFHVSGIMTIKSARYPLLSHWRYLFNLKVWVLKLQLWVLKLKVWFLQIKSLKILWMCLCVRSGGGGVLEVEVKVSL